MRAFLLTALKVLIVTVVFLLLVAAVCYIADMNSQIEYISN
jgi:hypothetical protein